GEGQAPGQYLQVDFGAIIPARQVVFDTGASTGDYPRGYTVQTSVNGMNWNTVVSNGQGAGQFTTVDLPGSAIQYVRITLATADPNDWWSVADVRAYVARTWQLTPSR
ncbi:MAG: Glucan endo,6-beta-glucosidase, partial [Actinomycetia bacterium]|nr:Glucan endo,6-beta-glucosidase [Actinomycetes bacterium]